MNFINRIIRKYKERKKASYVNQVNSEIQICEKRGQLWLKYAGEHICPMSYFIEPPIDVLTKIRALNIFEHELGYEK